VRALYQIWVNLITELNGHFARPDIAFIADKVDNYARIQVGNLQKVFRQQKMGAVADVLTQEAERQMYGVAANLRRDLEIMVREHEAFPSRVATEREHSMSQKIFSPGRRVLVGRQSRPGTVVSVDDQPSEMGEFRHTVKMD
jgi:hypothetical protein